MGYLHPSLVVAVCRIITPRPTKWEDKNIWLTFYSEQELADGVPIEVKWTIQKGFDYYWAFEKNSKIAD